jgi:hypothetical protein
MAQHAPQHRQNVETAQRVEESYTGIPAKDVKQIFSAALQLRFAGPDASCIIAKTGTKVQPEVVAAILEGALRLLPPGNSMNGQRLRREIAAEKLRHSAAAELHFATHIEM